MINVTRAFLSSIEEYNNFLERIWSNILLPYRRELVIENEKKLEGFLNVEHTQITNKGIVTNRILLKLLVHNVKIIRISFSYVADIKLIISKICKSIFVDIHSGNLIIDENKIEKKYLSAKVLLLQKKFLITLLDIGISNVKKKRTETLTF